MYSPGCVIVEVFAVGIHDVTFLVPEPTIEGTQVRMTVVTVEPRAVEVDSDTVVNERWTVVTTAVVRVGMFIHVWAMLEHSFQCQGKREARDQVYLRAMSPARDGGQRAEPRAI